MSFVVCALCLIESVALLVDHNSSNCRVLLPKEDAEEGEEEEGGRRGLMKLNDWLVDEQTGVPA